MLKTFFQSLVAYLVLVCFSAQAFAVSLIRDAEIEHTLRQFADPIFQAAGLKPSSIRLFIVRDSSLNAYVAGGANMFIHTGLITATTTPDMLLGVMAHETGHIAGGHLAKGSEKLKNAQMGTIMTFVLGAAAAVATGKPDAAAAVVTGGQSLVGRNFLTFTRTHENAADQAALGMLSKLGISASGMVKVFELLQRNERQHVGSRDPYTRTHPLSSERIEAVRSNIAKSSIPEGKYPASLDMPLQRMVAKLYGFIESPERTLQKYPLGNKTVPARLARAVAYYKRADLKNSLAEMDSLITEAPKDPFFYELKGQILFENRRGKEALAEYEMASKLLPNQPLILTDLARVELEQGGKYIASAVSHLEKSTSLDNTNPSSWRWLATAYGKAGNLSMSSLALAEESLLIGNHKGARGHAEHALDGLKQGTPAALRANDIKLRAAEMKREIEDE
ncbi:MAG: M48 family peptidase [Alphaproteobacteria bacterium]|nr:M48 family peptidase [Alphaproteobacteria bacterium]